MSFDFKKKHGQTLIEYLILFMLIGILVYGLVKMINDKALLTPSQQQSEAAPEQPKSSENTQS